MIRTLKGKTKKEVFDLSQYYELIVAKEHYWGLVIKKSFFTKTVVFILYNEEDKVDGLFYHTFLFFQKVKLPKEEI